LILLGCDNKRRDEAFARLSSPSAKQRAEAVRTLGKSGGDEAWAALSRAVRDGSPAVRAETAAALAAVPREDAPDAISPLLRDADDSVRTAAARALATRCGERSNAYLRLAFSHSDALVRAQLVEALRQCGVDPAQTLQREEADRRRKALELAATPFAAQRARAALELGLLGRDADRARILSLLDDRDGVVVAAAARALGESGAQEAAPRLRALLADGGEVAAAAAEALLALGPQAIAPARPPLLQLAAGAGGEALPAAAALAAQPRDAALCGAALAAQVPQAAALLAAGCPAAPFAQALGAAKKRDALFEALLRAGGSAPALEAALAKLLRAGETDARIPRLALRYRVAGPALVEALRREQAARAVDLRDERADDEGSAAEIAKTATGGAPDKERYARLMGLLHERVGAGSVRVSAAARLDALLHGDAASDRRAFLVAALQAVLSLKAPGAERVTAGFASDPDPQIGAAARGEPEVAATPAAAKPSPAPQLAFWSDDGAVRARACAAADPALAATRSLLAASDPERRVRDACASTNETAPRK
jgi:HEAT repeat protein